ncbi:hypothetical protein K493DRAFT_341784 [Basidiobolus meristosporus CBS 931.73]|uniref:3'-5' exonuclease domain-containing protein n=1 Tax=Basidiobolus meristosporus CBS 931.73 TaxID=1314790 RepID=A0A1Y1XI66_9FUNG|nr:hypothetical protein K493DRAFT_341784 [Basidiobolus meristosporus CBS 931.73]|eukprot:ORX85445.1 hypothetical protein K493DRAFT_341784 [Basidiobolus meristosporus CBS 931.73]
MSNIPETSPVEAPTFDSATLINELRDTLEAGQYSKALGICQRLVRKAQRESPLPEIARETVMEELACIDAYLAGAEAKRPVEQTPAEEEEISKPSSLIKFSKKLISEYNLELTSFPNIHMAHLHNHFRWLLYSRKSAPTKTTENWDTLIEYALSEHPELASTGIQQLLKYKDIKGIYQFFGKEVGDKYKEQITIDPAVEEIAREAKEMSLAKYCKPEEVRIIFVADEHTLRECEISILRSSVTRVGIDCEWRPMTFTDVTRCALIQIGTEEKIYLLDAVNLPREPVSRFLTSLFCSEEVSKYGYNFSSDIFMLCKSYPEIEGCKLCQYINLATPQPLLSQVTSLECNGNGLAALVKAVLKCELDKKFQISDWERRPLLQDQMLYAANDAYCLLEIADSLQSIIAKSVPEVSVLLQRAMEPTTTILTLKREKPRKTREIHMPRTRQISRDDGEQKHPVTKIHLLIDPNLPKLARKLRLCGIDTIIPSSDNPQQILDMITSEKSPRTFFTKTKALYSALCSHLRNTSVDHSTGQSTLETAGLHLLEANTTIEQIAEIVGKMNIRVTTRDLLSRCTKCNSNRWIRRTPEDIQERQDFGGTRYNDFNQRSNQVKRKDWIPQTICEKVSNFIECAECNKIYWVGGHAEKVAKGMEGILEDAPEDS